MRVLKLFSVSLVAVSALTLLSPASAQTVFSGTGGPNLADASTPAGSAKEAFLAFQTAAGGGSARRISWDGVVIPKTGTNPTEIAISNNIVGINTTRFSGVGAFYAETHGVSNDGFGTANPAIAGQFPAFSGANTFASFATSATPNTTIEQRMVVPGAGSTAPGVSRGFGAIFMDVELAGLTTISYFNNGTLLGTFAVPVAGNGQFSFLGVLYNDAVVTDVTLTLGNRTLFNFIAGNVSNNGGEGDGIDLVGTDDFLFANPVATPEPGAGLLGLLGAVGFGVIARLRRK